MKDTTTLSLFPAAPPDEVPLEDKIKAVERELAMRRRVYPRMVRKRRMSPIYAEEQIRIFVSILNDYNAVAARNARNRA